jgi:HEAT repeat protein
LVYHFQRSANQEKAKNYEKSQELNYQKLFNPFEALQYTGERRKRRGELPAPGLPLDPAGLAQISAVIRCLHTAVRQYRLYPPGSETIVSTNRQLKEAIDSILTTNENLAIFHINQALMINGQKVDVSEFKWVAEDLLKFLMRVELKGIVFHRGLTDQELEALMEALGRIKPKMIDKNYWRNFSTIERLQHIELKQVQYTLMVEPGAQARVKGASPGAAKVIPLKVSYQMLAGDQKLDQDDLNRIPEIIRCLLSAAKNIKLYPVDSKAISGTIDPLMEALRSILSRRPVLTLAQVSHSLLVNGVRVDTSEIKTLAESFMKFLSSIMLSSITFMDRLSDDELKTFIGALGQLPTTGLDGKFWTRFAEEHGFSTILFDQVIYESRVTPTLAAYDLDQMVEEPSEEYWIVQISAPIAEELVDTFFKEMPGRLNDLLIKGDEKQILQLVRRLFQGFQNRPILTREKIIESCRRLLESLTLAFQPHFAKILSDPLLVAFSREKDPNILRQIAFLLYHIATHLIQFAEYPLSSRILLNLHQRHQKLLATKDPHAQRLATVLDRKLDPTTQKLLLNDLKSSETSKQQNVTQLLSSLGQVTIPLLIDIIKKEEDFRVRQIAASLLGEMGPEAAELLKHELILGGTAVERIRILEVIDTVTRDLKTELTFAMSDETPEVRQTAFQLAERLNNSQVVELLLDYAKSQNADLAVEAIECLGKLKPLAAVEVLVSLLNTTHDTKRLIACCQALGQIADPACVGPLMKILKRKGSFFHRKRRSPQVRATAAFALAQISHPRVVELFTHFVDDRDPRVKEIAQKRVNAIQPPPAQEKGPNG